MVVAAADRGNHPLVNFEAPDGRVRDWFPSLLAVSGDKRVYGWEALEQQSKPGWTMVRSLKRRLKSAGPCSMNDIAGQPLNLSLLLTEMMLALRRPPSATLWLTLAGTVLGFGVWIRGSWWPLSVFLLAVAATSPALRRKLLVPVVAFAVMAAPQVLRSSLARDLASAGSVPCCTW